VIRQLLPVFVASPNIRPAEPEWQVERVDPGDGNPSGYRVNVHNLGDRRLRLSGLSLANEDGTLLAQNPGLVGYVLGQSRMSFLIPDIEGGAADPAGRPLHQPGRIAADGAAGRTGAGFPVGRDFPRNGRQTHHDRRCLCLLLPRSENGTGPIEGTLARKFYARI